MKPTRLYRFGTVAALALTLTAVIAPAQSLPAPQPPQAPAGLHVTITPAAASFYLRELIYGSCTIRNTGAAPVSTTWSALPHVYIVHADGTPVAVKPIHVPCGNGLLDSPPVTLQPGQEQKLDFAFNSDQLAPGSCKLTPGIYHLKIGPRTLAGGIPVTGADLTIQLHPPRDGSGPRIINLAAGSDRISVLREDGTLESFSVASGKRLASLTLPNYQTRGWQDGDADLFSRDAHSFGRITRDALDAPFHLHVYDLTQDPPGVRELTPEDVLSRSPSPVRLNDNSVTVAGPAGLYAVFRNAPITTLLSRQPFVRSISDDSLHFVREELHSALTLRTMDGSLVRSLGERPHHAGIPTLLLGARGVYLGFSGQAGISLFPFNAAAPAITFPDAPPIPLAEDTTGAWVALGTTTLSSYSAFRERSRLEIWQTDPVRKACVIQDDEYRTPFFTTDPPRLVCALVVTDQNPFESARWYRDDFEVRKLGSSILSTTLHLAPAAPPDARALTPESPAP